MATGSSVPASSSRPISAAEAVGDHRSRRRGPADKSLGRAVKRALIFPDMAFHAERASIGKRDAEIDTMPNDLAALNRAIDQIAAIALRHLRTIGTIGEDHIERFRGDDQIHLGAALRLGRARRATQRSVGGLDDGKSAVAALEPAGDDRVPADEAGDEARPWPGIELEGLADLLHLAAVHDDDAVGKHQGLGLGMGDEDEGDAEAALQELQLVLDRFAQIGIERAERLVEQQDLRLDDEAARQRHALALTTR